MYHTPAILLIDRPAISFEKQCKVRAINFPGTRIQPTLYLQKAKINNKQPKNSNTVEPRFNDLRYNDIPSITIHICLPSKRYSKMYGAEPNITTFGIMIFPVYNGNVGDQAQNISSYINTV